MFVLAFIIVLPIRYFIVQPFRVQGASMEPTFYERDYLLIDEISYRFNEPRRGDVVVFRYPEDPQEHFIKRLIGLPGETVHIADGNVSITDAAGNTKILKESYLPNYVKTVGWTVNDITLKPNEYYFLGDNRNGSKDSRVFGPVNKNFITGRVIFRGYPFNNIGTVQTPAY